MIRLAPLIVAVALLVSVTSVAYAQVNVTYGYPTVGQGAVLAPVQPGYIQPGAVQPAYIGGVSYTGLALPYVGAPSYNYSTIAPYTTGTTYYRSGYTGYVAPGTTMIGQRGAYPSYPLNYSYGYGPGFRAGNPYASGMVYPYGRGLRTFGRGIGIGRR